MNSKPTMLPSLADYCSRSRSRAFDSVCTVRCIGIESSIVGVGKGKIEVEYKTDGNVIILLVIYVVLYQNGYAVPNVRSYLVPSPISVNKKKG